MAAVVVAAQRLLMVRRGHEPLVGRWSLPGGGLEAGESLTDGVRREVLEETGLRVEVTGLAGVFEALGPPHFVILDYFARALHDRDPVAAEDANEARWVPLGDVADLDCTPHLVATLRSWGVAV